MPDRKMTHVHVCLVSEQPIPNLTTVLQFRPDEVILLKTKEMEEKASFLENVIKKKNFNISSELIEAYDMDNVISVSDSIITQCNDCRVTMNITGGTKIGTLGTFQAFYTAGKEIYYVDTLHNRILTIAGETKKSQPINVKISIDDYLAVYGFEVESYVRNDEYIFARKDLTQHIAKIASSSEEIISNINWKLYPYNEESLPIEIEIPKGKQLMKYLKSLPGITVTNDKKIIISDPETFRYLKGGWFEEYVYMIAKSLSPDEIKLNVVGRWITKGKHKPKNEFDVIISKGNRLFWISCKTANPDRRNSNYDEGIGRQYLYELDSLSDHALGLFGKRMLVSARKIDDQYVRERARILNIKLVDGKDIITLKENLRQWLSS